MTIEEAVFKAISQGWRKEMIEEGNYKKAGELEQWEEYGTVIDHMDSFLLDPEFWKALGKSMGWKDSDHECVGCTEWIDRWHSLIDYVADNKSIESYFETLT